MTKTCSISGCCEPVLARGLCSPHYARKRRGGDMGPPVGPKERQYDKRICKHPGCGRPGPSAGWCPMHYNRNKRGLDMDMPHQARINMGKICSIAGCEHPAEIKGMCAPHYMRAKRGGPMDRPIKKSKQHTQCSVLGCDNKYKGGKYCGEHSRRVRHFGEESLLVRPRPECCELCGSPETHKHNSGGPKRLAWDHDHATNKFRGWLCGDCNTTLGKAQDNPSLLRKMAIYVETAGACIDS